MPCVAKVVLRQAVQDRHPRQGQIQRPSHLVASQQCCGPFAGRNFGIPASLNNICWLPGGLVGVRKFWNTHRPTLLAKRRELIGAGPLHRSAAISGDTRACRGSRDNLQINTATRGRAFGNFERHSRRHNVLLEQRRGGRGGDSMQIRGAARAHFIGRLWRQWRMTMRGKPAYLHSEDDFSALHWMVERAAVE